TASYTFIVLFFFSSRRRHTRFDCDWSSDVCSSDLGSPILLRHASAIRTAAELPKHHSTGLALAPSAPPAGPCRAACGHTHPTCRSEERRVGKECRSRWSRDQ